MGVLFRAHEVVEPAPAPTACLLKAQGATEYLVLLAVVLIIALVSVALLGFFPGMASDSQIAQSNTYWQSATPIAIGEDAAKFSGGWGGNLVYLKLRNTGAYPIRITKVLGGTNSTGSQFLCYDLAFCGSAGGVAKNISEYYYLASGEEKYLGGHSTFGVTARLFAFLSDTPNSVDTYMLRIASSLCQNSNSTPGTLIVKNFGFEYIEYLDNNQQLTKRFIGAKPLIIKCVDPI